MHDDCIDKQKVGQTFIPTVSHTLIRPCLQLQAFDSLQTLPPYALWSKLTAIALGGSLLYGASLSLLFPGWRPTRSALWLALSAGGCWCIFGPVIVVLSRRRIRSCVQASLTTMAYGEAILTIGTAINVGLRLRGCFRQHTLAYWNIMLVGCSNLVMALALTRQLQALQVPTWKTLTAWIVVLDGSGAVMFALMKRLLSGGRQ